MGTHQPITIDQEIATNASIPAYPMLFEKSGTTDLSQAAGVIGILRNGVAMYRFGTYVSANLREFYF